MATEGEQTGLNGHPKIVGPICHFMAVTALHKVGCLQVCHAFSYHALPQQSIYDRAQVVTCIVHGKSTSN